MPTIYWISVALISVVGTLITDNLTDNLGVALELTTAVFAVALATTFAIWYASERTLSIHSITTTKREGFYWLAILFTFALGTAAGDLVSERMDIGYLKSALLFIGLIAAVAVAHYVFHLDPCNQLLAGLYPDPAARGLHRRLSSPSRAMMEDSASAPLAQRCCFWPRSWDWSRTSTCPGEMPHLLRVLSRSESGV